MFAASTYRICFAKHEDADTLRRFARLDSGRPFVGHVLIGHVAGKPAAVLSLRDGRVVVDPSLDTNRLVADMRVRADVVQAYETTPSLRERLITRLPASYWAQTGGETGPISRNGHREHSPVLVDTEPRSMPSPRFANAPALSTAPAAVSASRRFSSSGLH
jgi:hypothetical protein